MPDRLSQYLERKKDALVIKNQFKDLKNLLLDR